MRSITVARRLSLRAESRHYDAVNRTERAADAADAAVHKVWADVLRLLANETDPVVAYFRAVQVFRRLLPAARRGLADGLGGLMRWSHRSAVDAILQTMPKEWLTALLVKRRVVESRALREDLLGSLRFFYAPGGTVGFDEPPEELTADQQRELLQRFVFAPPERSQTDIFLNRLISGFAPRPDLVSPELLGGIVSAGFSQGKTSQQIAADLLPAVDGVRVSARRTARTWGIHIAHSASMDAYDELGDMVIGYQVHATLDTNTRPEHRKRDGTIYYREPEAGQKGFDEMPQPPLEADGSVAWN